MPWVLVAAVAVYSLLWVETPGADIARFAAYWVLCLALPGTLVFRALRGSRGNWPEDIGYGAAVGLILEGGVWAAASAVGELAWLRFWPVPLVVAFLAVRPLRRYWRTGERRNGERQPLPVLWSWGIAAAMIVAILWIAGLLKRLPLPPADASYYPDLLYHLSLVRELMRPMPFEVPQHAGDPLKYHLLSHAHMATGSHISGVDPTTIVFRLWPIPIVLLAILLVAAVARELSGKAWAGPLAGALVVVDSSLVFGGPLLPLGISPLNFNSPSQAYVLPPLMLTAALCIDAVRDRPLGRAWALLPAAALACAGAKASGLPLLVAGVGLAIVAGLVVRRRIPWRASGALGGLVAGMGLGVVLFVDSSGGGLQLQLFSTLQWIDPYRETLGAAYRATMPGPLPPGLVNADASAWQFAVYLVAWHLIAQLPLLVGLAIVAWRRTRRDPAAWLLGGALLAAEGALWLIFHAGESQLYFLRSALPLGVLAAVWLLAEVTEGRRAPFVAAAGGVGGALLTWALWSPISAETPAPSMPAWLGAIYRPLVPVAVVTLGLVLCWWVARTFVKALRGRGPTVAISALLGAGLFVGAAGLWYTVAGAYRGRSSPTAATAAPGPMVWAGEMRAAMWLDANAGPDDVLATNVHCGSIRTRPACESRAFWVSGLSGRSVVVEGWAFVPASVRYHGFGGLGYSQQPPPDLKRYALNERVFRAPTAEDLRTLRERYGVRWLFADTRAGPVATSALADLTTVRYVDGPVTVYELPA